MPELGEAVKDAPLKRPIPTNRVIERMALAKRNPQGNRRVQRSEAALAARTAIYQEVRNLYQAGKKKQEIGHQLKISQARIRRLLASSTPPQPIHKSSQTSKLAEYKPYLLRRFADGCRNARQLQREIMEQGYRGGYTVLGEYIAQLREKAPLDLEEVEIKERPKKKGRANSASEKKIKIQANKPNKQTKARIRTEPGGTGLPSIRRMAWWFVVKKEKVPEKQRGQLEKMLSGIGEIRRTYELAQEFARMIRELGGEKLDEWLSVVAGSEISGLISFGNGIERDKAAVKLGLSLHINNGRVEGAVNRLKLIKRSGYGRAKFDLLRKRVVLKTAA